MVEPRNIFTRIELVALTAALIWGGTLRLGWPGLNPFAFDESRLSLMALELAKNGIFPKVGLPSSAGIPNLPIQVWLFAIPYAFSTDPKVASSFVGLLSLLSLMAIWWLARSQWGPEAGLVTVWLTAGSPYLAFYSRSVWPQNWLPILSAIWLTTVVFKRKKIAFFLNGFVTGLAFQVHYAGIALLLPSLFLVITIPAKLRQAWFVGLMIALVPAFIYGKEVVRAAKGIGLEIKFGLKSFLQTVKLLSGYGWEILLLGPGAPNDWKALPLAGLLVPGMVWGILCLVRQTVRAKGGFHVLTLITGMASPVLWVFHFTSPLLHYHLISLPSLFLVIGYGTRHLPYRLSLLAVFLAVGISLGQGLMFIKGLNLCAIKPLRGGINVPLVLQQAAVDFVKDGPPVLAITPGNRPEQDGDAAILEVLLWGYPHRIVDGLHSLIIPSEPAWLLFVGPWMPAWEEALAHLPPESYEVYFFPRREGEVLWAILKFRGARPTGFKPVEPVYLACGATLEGWNLEEKEDRIRVKTLWKVKNPERGRIHQFHHPYLDGTNEPFMVQDRPTSSEAWMDGDYLITWADFPPV